MGPTVLSWGISGVNYQLYRSSEPDGNYELIDAIVAPADTTFNFELEDQLPPVGQAYYYYLTGEGEDLAPHISDTIFISRLPAIKTNGLLQHFFQELGTPSPAQEITITAENLLDEVHQRDLNSSRRGAGRAQPPPQ